MAPGELQASSWEARGCVRRSFFVRFLYLFKASLIINWKSEDEEDEESAGRVSAIEVRVRKIIRCIEALGYEWGKRETVRWA